MRWLIAGLAFASVVGLAVTTASIRIGNVQLRANIQQLGSQIEIECVSAAAARERYAEATRPEQLLRMWRVVEAAIERAGVE